MQPRQQNFSDQTSLQRNADVCNDRAVLLAPPNRKPYLPASLLSTHTRRNKIAASPMNPRLLPHPIFACDLRSGCVRRLHRRKGRTPQRLPSPYSPPEQRGLCRRPSVSSMNTTDASNRTSSHRRPGPYTIAATSGTGLVATADPASIKAAQPDSQERPRRQRASRVPTGTLALRLTGSGFTRSSPTP